MIFIQSNKPINKINGSIKWRFVDLGGYCVGADLSASPEIIAIADTYKTKQLKIMRSLRPYHLEPTNKWYKTIPDDLIATLKRDGMFNILYFDKSSKPFSVFCNSPYGKVRYNLPVNKEFEYKINAINESDSIDNLNEILASFHKREIFEEKCKIRSLVLAGELHALDRQKNGRPRIDNLLVASLYPKSMEDLDRICFDAFDVLSINEVNTLDLKYQQRLEILNALFPCEIEENSSKIRVIWHKIGIKASQIRDLFDFWVNQQGQEGLVIHTKFGLKYKLKPEHEVDAVITGFAEMPKENAINQKCVGSLLIAVMRPDGTFLSLTSVDAGLTNDQRTEFYELLKSEVVNSNYRIHNEAGQPFSFVEPLHVIKVKFIDLLTKSSTGQDILRWALKYENKEWKKVEKVPSAELLNPWFSQMRSNIGESSFSSLHSFDPKNVNYQEIPIDQITNLVQNTINNK